MLDEFAFMTRTKVQIIFFNFPVLVIFSAKCCNFSMYLCYHAFLDCQVFFFFFFFFFFGKNTRLYCKKQITTYITYITTITPLTLQ